MTFFGRSRREEAAYLSFFYPDSDVLINHLNIRDFSALEAAERAFVSRRMMQPLPAAATPLTYEGFKAIHRHLFQDVYAWAGSIRTYTSGRGPAPFAMPEFIDQSMEAQFARVGRIKELRGISPSGFAQHAAALVNEINAVHPFVEGNGRTQRVWLRLLGAEAGHKITLRSEDRDAWYDASRVGFERQDHRPMEALIAARIESLGIHRDNSDGIDV